MTDYACFDKEEINIVQQKLIEQFKKQIKNLNELSKPDSEISLNVKIMQVVDKTNYLPTPLKEKINYNIRTYMEDANK